MKIESDKVIYRRATVKDANVLSNLRLRFLNELFHHPFDEESDNLRKDLYEYFLESIPKNDFVAWLAEYRGKIIGTSGMVIWRIPPRYGIKRGRLGYILNMYTLPEGRKKGICTQLLNELIKEAKALGLTYLHLHSSEEGISIYRKAGFIDPLQEELELNL
ncbi:MAG: hypothetical protein AMS17_18590 [Spirochaetes bacterium DG_61]|nr:MAG: hypothetical protein AMS17_18590 [Spirochaetes bacterium DG_61]